MVCRRARYFGLLGDCWREDASIRRRGLGRQGCRFRRLRLGRFAGQGFGLGVGRAF